MSERLKFFRRLMSAFEGTSNPQRAVERGFYVNLPNNPVGEITRRIELRPSSVHLLFGGIGSGKTTQLLLTQQALNELEDIKAIYIDVSLVTDISDLKSDALIVIAGLELIEVIGKSSFFGNPELKGSKELVEKRAYGYSENKVSGKSLNRQSLLSDENKKNRESLLQSFDALVKAFKKKFCKEIIFLFDSLDRLKESSIFIDPVLNDIAEINKYGVGVILVGSIVTPYTDRVRIAEITRNLHFLSYLDVLESDETQLFFTEVFNIRDPEKFINQDAREILISHSGGVLRDLMSLCQAAIEEAYMDGSEQITKQHADQAILALARSKIIGLTDANINKLRKIASEESFPPRIAEDFELMLTGHILEYKYPRQRFVVHPILSTLIKSKPVSVTNG
jgi:Cdc6-like AAA superfamily ATPase